jgi:hypothetical protein
MRARWLGAKPVCPKCGGVFSVYTGTIFPRTKRSCREVILILRGFARGVSTNRRHAARTAPPLSGEVHLRVVTDEWRASSKLSEEGRPHTTVNHGRREVHSNTM